MISFNPGPSQLSPAVIQFLHEIADSGFLSMSHRSSAFAEASRNAVEGLRKQMGIPADYHIFYQPSATVAMDTLLRNVPEKSSFHFVHGNFSERFFQTAISINLEAVKHETALDAPIDWRQADILDSELICLTHCETSTGIMWPHDEMQGLREAYPQAMIAIDVTSSFGGMQFEWHHADLWFGSVQKCLGLPSGFGFLIVSPRAFEKGLAKKDVPAWHRFEVLAKYMKDYFTLETPNMLAIALLGRQMAVWDLKSIEAETKRKAALIYEANLPWKPFIRDPLWRSLTVSHFLVDQPGLWKKRALEAKMILGSGYGAFEPKSIRIANFPSHSYEMLSQLLHVLRESMY